MSLLRKLCVDWSDGAPVRARLSLLRKLCVDWSDGAPVRARLSLLLTQTLRAGLLAGVAAVLALAAVFAPAAPSAASPTAPREPAALRQPPIDSASIPQDALAPSTGLDSACAALLEDFSGGVTEECWDALETHFLPLPVARAILPVPPLTWRDVFSDIAADIDAVDAALADEDCAVPAGEIRPELAPRCAARAMAELHVLRNACARLSYAPSFSLSRAGFDLESLRMTNWSRMDRAPYKRNVNSAVREKTLARWAEEAPDQEAYLAGRKRVDELYYRTAWKRVRCAASEEMVAWMHGDRWRGLLGHAARLGDEFALAGHVRDWRHTAFFDTETAEAGEVADRRHAAKLMELNPPQGLLQLASLDIQDVRDAWNEEDSAASWRLFEERLDDRIRLLKMAGIDCADPCTVKAVDKLEHLYRRRLSDCRAEKCANLADMTKLDAELDRPLDELYLARPARSLPHRKRLEAVALKYVMAVESLAEATGVDVDKELLRRMADPDDPELLTKGEVEQARFEAAQLVVAQARP